MVNNFRQYFFLGGEVGLARRLLEMNQKISVHCVDSRIVIHLLVAFIVHCRFGFLQPSFAQILFYTFG